MSTNSTEYVRPRYKSRSRFEKIRVSLWFARRLDYFLSTFINCFQNKGGVRCRLRPFVWKNPRIVRGKKELVDESIFREYVSIDHRRTNAFTIFYWALRSQTLILDRRKFWWKGRKCSLSPYSHLSTWCLFCETLNNLILPNRKHRTNIWKRNDIDTVSAEC